LDVEKKTMETSRGMRREANKPLLYSHLPPNSRDLAIHKIIETIYVNCTKGG
jgi:hypothetical protein